MNKKSNSLEQQLENVMRNPVLPLNKGDREQVTHDIRYLQRNITSSRKALKTAKAFLAGDSDTIYDYEPIHAPALKVTIKGEVFGASILEEDEDGKMIMIYIYDDGWWHPKMSFHEKWCPELMDVVTRLMGKNK